MSSSAAVNRWVTDFCRENPFRPRIRETQQVAITTAPHVYIDCRGGYSKAYGSFRASVKRCIRKSESSSLEYRRLSTREEIDMFADLYDQSMRRLNASKRYCFGPEYFRTLSLALGPYLHIDGVHRADRLIAGGVRLVGNGYSFAYLQCSDTCESSVKPSHFLHNEAVKTYCAQSLDRFILGGGVPGRPGVLDFKNFFSPHHIDVTFVSRVLDAPRYAELCLAAGVPPDDLHFFPPYRAQPQ